MRHLIIVALSVGWILAGVNHCHAEQPEKDQPSLLAQQSWVRLAIVLGRITAETTSPGRNKSASRDEPTIGKRETLSACFQSGFTSVRYELTNPEQRLTVSVVNGKQVEMVRNSQAGSLLPHLRYVQKLDDPVLLTIGEGKSQVRYSAASLWHLFLAHEEACREHLLPILEAMQPSWKLATQIEELQDALVVLAESGIPSHRQQWALWVRQLGSDDFQERRGAVRQLSQAGQAVLFYFNSLDLATLDSEQRQRIAEIRKAVTVRSGDTPRRVASWLVDDPSIWISLLSHKELTYRQVAVMHLGRIQGASIDFDPQQSEPLRQTQIKRLRRQLVAGH